MYTLAYILILDYIEQDFKTSLCQNNSVFSQMKIGFPRKIHRRSRISLMILFSIFLLPLSFELLYNNNITEINRNFLMKLFLLERISQKEKFS